MVVGVGDPPPVDGAVVVVVVVGIVGEVSAVGVLVVELQFVLFELQPVVPLFLGSTPTARRASANTPTATAPRMILRRRLVARSPVDPLDPFACSVEVMVSSAVSSVGCDL
ncbi:MAG: hypothetical protein RLY23_1748 [Actinomycetota bacterium]